VGLSRGPSKVPLDIPDMVRVRFRGKELGVMVSLSSGLSQVTLDIPDTVRVRARARVRVNLSSRPSVTLDIPDMVG
jgi:aconitase B